MFPHLVPLAPDDLLQRQVAPLVPVLQLVLGLQEAGGEQPRGRHDSFHVHSDRDRMIATQAAFLEYYTLQPRNGAQKYEEIFFTTDFLWLKTRCLP